MDTKALEKAEQATKTAVAEYEKLVAAETDYKAKIAAAKTTALTAAGEVRRLRKEMIGVGMSDLLGSISTRGRKFGTSSPRSDAGASTPGVTTGKKRGRPAKVGA